MVENLWVKLGDKEQQMIKLAAPAQLEAVSCYRKKQPDKPEWRVCISDKWSWLFCEPTTKK